MTETKAVATKTDAALPAHLQNVKKTSSFGNVDQTDLIIPRIKLLQSVSEEVTAFDKAKVGDFWHTISEESLGNKVRIIPLIMQKSAVLWAPRGDDRGILARSSDCVNWDEGYANMEYTVKIRNVGDIKYLTKGNVEESGLMKFGSSVPKDTNSRPAASLTYRFMFWLPDYPELGPAIVINTRSSIKPAKNLITKIEMRPCEHYDGVYVMGTTDEAGDEGPYKGYSYTADGYTTEEEHEISKAMFEKFKVLDWKVNDEHDEGGNAGGGAGARGSAPKPGDDSVPF